VGAINGALVAADPAGAAAQLAGLWQGNDLREAFSETVLGRLSRLARSGTHLHSIEPLQRMLEGVLPGKDFADLELPFHCVAASIERARARWFSTGPIVPAVLASCAVPGLLAPVEVDGEHYFDGGLVDSIPVGRAVSGHKVGLVLRTDVDRHVTGDDLANGEELTVVVGCLVEAEEERFLDRAAVLGGGLASRLPDLFLRVLDQLRRGAIAAVHVLERMLGVGVVEDLLALAGLRPALRHLGDELGLLRIDTLREQLLGQFIQSHQTSIGCSGAHL
jgi:predicted acylesterase/phospholipase RssA